jgi:hypothetical protein
MGVKYLYNYLAPIIKSGDLKDFKGQVIGVDAMIYIYVYLEYNFTDNK